MQVGSDAEHPHQAGVYRSSVSVDPGDQGCAALNTFESHEARNLGCVAYMHDALAAVVTLDPDLVTTQATTVEVELTYPLDLTVADWSSD
ncbi:nucleoside hydrolase [Mycobacterium leprae]|uniref:nucleoside hydrolase n=1 Tax=Mycobacterium leprae TaxID=1769 RepID=UPI001E41308B|nr:nucleoside hydrolase [Mycobacterium leprae]